MLSVPTLAKNFKKSIETTIAKKGKTVEKLYNFALKNAIAYNKEGYNKGTEFVDIFRKPLMLLFDKIIFKAVRQGLGGQMKFFVGGGALLDIDLQRYYYAIGIPMYQGYGLSEATPIISANSPAKHIFGSSGKVVTPMEIKILDADGVEQPYGSKGEICIKGENVMAGYWKNPKSTADTIVDGWLHTGDMGYMRDAEMLYVVGRFKSLLIAADGEKYSPEGIEEHLVESSKYIDGALLHNSQDPYTIALITPNKEALKAYAKELGLDPATKEAKVKMLELLQDEVNMYRKGGRMFGAFPERWLPAAVCVLPEPWTEQNHFLNSSMKVVRGRVEEAYKANMEFAYTPEGKNIVNEMNLASLWPFWSLLWLFWSAAQVVDIQLHTEPACRQKGARGFFNSLTVSGLRGSRSAAILPNHGHSTGTATFLPSPAVRYARFCDWNLYHVLREMPILRQIFVTVIPEASIASMRSELSRITCIFTSLPGLLPSRTPSARFRARASFVRIEIRLRSISATRPNAKHNTLLLMELSNVYRSLVV